MHFPKILPMVVGALLASFCVVSIACQPPREGETPPLIGKDLARAVFSQANAVFVARVTSYRDSVSGDSVTTTATLVPLHRFKGAAHRFLRHHSSTIRAMDCTLFHTISDGGYYIYFGSLIDNKPVFRGALSLAVDENGKLYRSSVELIEEFSALAQKEASK